MEYGFIGIGKMGSAIAENIAANGCKDLSLANRTVVKAENLAKKIGATVSTNKEVAEKARYIILAVKPQVMPEIAKEIKSVLAGRTDKFVLVSMAAGLSVNTLCKMFGNYPIIRIMPNTPITLGKGTVLYTAFNTEKNVVEKFCRDISGCGETVEIKEELMDAASVVSGCGPAYFYLFTDAVARAGEKCGLDYNTALRLAAQTAIGSGAMVLESRKDATTLVSDVCSKGGSTIEGVNYFNNSDFAIITENALKASFLRTKELGKK